MSFSGDVKEELSAQISAGRHCQLAELMAIFVFCGKLEITENGGMYLKIQTENLFVAKKCFLLIKKIEGKAPELFIRQNVHFKKSKTYFLIIKEKEDVVRLLQATKLWNEADRQDFLVNHLVIQNACCKRAFIRGAFLAAGSISDPEKFYHFEIVCQSMERAEQVQSVIQSFQIDAKIVSRKKYFVVYIKEGSQIVDILNVMEAHVSLMNLENVRILKEMRNSVNRQVNCETANINKTVSAAVKQVEDIMYIRDTVGFGGLSEGLEEIAVLRLENPEATLKELGQMLVPAVGKSGVNHRLRKLGEIASQLRDKKEEM